nr:hypothetical protein BaRGS_019524 [Batillaria attramentaria]
MSLDNRPKTLEVRGFELDEVEELKAHFGTFGEIIKTDIKEDIPCALVTFSNRKQAELAYSGGSKFKKKQLSLHWHLGVVRMVSVESEAATEDDDDDEDGESAVGVGEEESAVGEGEEAQATAGGEAELEEQLLQATEEEEDEDQESRAWRR